MKKEKIKVAIYCRVGNESQVSNKFQMETIKKHCDLLNYETFKIYEDNSSKNLNTNGAGYKNMLSDLKDGKFNCIMVYSLNKIGKNIVEFNEFIRLLKLYNCSFYSIREDIDFSTASNIFCARLMSIIMTHGKELYNDLW